MNHHKDARLTYGRRLEMVRQITQDSLTPAAAATVAGVSEPTARNWLGRYLAGGEPALVDASSRPAHSPRRISESKALAIVELRRRRLTQARIGFTQMQPDERGPSAVAFLRAAAAYHASLGIKVLRVLTDNGSPFMSRAWRDTCAELGIVHKRTRAFRPQTNG